MKINLYFQHGWGFAKQSWQKIIPEQDRFAVFLADRGYFAEPAKLPPCKANEFNVTICHSLGLHLCQDFLQHCDLLVILAGFKYFHGEERSAGIFSRKHLKRMLTQLNANPIELLNKFYLDCSYFKQEVSMPNMNLDLLKSDLQLLNTHRLDLDSMQPIPQVLVLHGSEDRIVPLQRGKYLAQSIHNSIFVEVNGAGHGLPFTHSDNCWQIIKEQISKQTDEQ